MIRRGLFRFLLVSLVFFGTMSLIGRWSYSAGWTRGYFDSQATRGQEATAEEAPPAAAPQPAPGPYGQYGPGYSPFGWFFGGLLKFFFLLLLVGFLFRLLFGWRWRHHHHGGHWGKRPFSPREDSHKRSHFHGPEPREKSPEDVEPDIRTI